MGQGMYLALVMSTPPVTRAVVIINPHGLHARPAERLARLAMQFDSRIEMLCRNERIDVKSILHLLTMGATQGTELVIEAQGHDAREAVEALARLIESGFAEVYAADEGAAG
jgi:phosphotransferase system HPr (HPr) family protein